MFREETEPSISVKGVRNSQRLLQLHYTRPMCSPKDVLLRAKLLREVGLQPTDPALPARSYTTTYVHTYTGGAVRRSSNLATEHEGSDPVSEEFWSQQDIFATFFSCLLFKKSKAYLKMGLVHKLFQCSRLHGSRGLRVSGKYIVEYQNKRLHIHVHAVFNWNWEQSFSKQSWTLLRPSWMPSISKRAPSRPN